MSWGYGWRPYVPVAQRRANAVKEAARLAKKGRVLAPVRLDGRAIARTFWGKSWCDNLEAYSDFANRLPRGRTYVRNRAVVDLQIAPGKVTALVSGSEIYEIVIQIQPLPKAVWTRIQMDCAGRIDSLMEMLQGRLSSAVMQTVTRKEGGLFPKPAEIEMECSCPDWAGLCKHVAASLYGVGSRLDEKPELLFLLRGVDPADLIARASASEAVRQSAPVAGAGLSDDQLADVFGIELDTAATPAAPTPSKAVTSSKAAGKPAAGRARKPGTTKTRSSPKKAPSPIKKPGAIRSQSPRQRRNAPRLRRSG